MSYILDALKKSEQQRGHDSIPNVQTIHSSSLNYRDEKKAYWPYVLIIAVILNLIAIVYFIIERDTISEADTISVGQTTLEDKTKNTIIVDDMQTQVREKLIASEDKITNAETQQEKEKAALLSANTAIKNTDSKKNKETLPAVNKPLIQAQKEIISFYDLPASVQQQLPAIIVSAHIYSSNPLQRSMIINNNFMEEGEYVIDDLILYEITTDGAIFDYAKTRFYYNMVSGWR